MILQETLFHNLCPILLGGSPWVDIERLGDGKLVEGTVIAEILCAGHHIFPFSTILLYPILFKGEAVSDSVRRKIATEPAAIFLALINLLSKAKHWVLVVITRPELGVKVFDSFSDATLERKLRNKLEKSPGTCQGPGRSKWSAAAF